MSDRDCDNCAHHSEGGCSVWECSFERKKDDTISRQAAVDALCGECQGNCIPCEHFPCGEIKAVQALPPAQPEVRTQMSSADCISRQAAIEWCLEGLNNMPSADSERKRGKWTDDNACPFCGFHPWYERDIHTLSFCPNCGADMRGEQDG